MELGQDLEQDNDEDAQVYRETAQEDAVQDYFQSKRQQKAKAPRILSINDPRKTQWDLLVMILATFNVFVIPLDVGFEPQAF